MTKVSHLELDVLRAVVVLHPKGNWQDHCTEWCSRVCQDDAVEWSFARGEYVGNVQPHLLQSTCEEQVEAAPAVDEYSGHLCASHDKI
jgi:hypothetical protein